MDVLFFPVQFHDDLPIKVSVSQTNPPAWEFAIERDQRRFACGTCGTMVTVETTNYVPLFDHARLHDPSHRVQGVGVGSVSRRTE